MVDVAADLRAGLVRAIGPLDAATLRHGILDADVLQSVRTEVAHRLSRNPSEADCARLLGVRAVALRMLGDFEAAEADAATALDHAEASGADSVLSPARARLANILRVQGRFDAADKLFAMAEAGEIPRTLLGAVRAYAGLSCLGNGRHTEALIHFQRAIDDNAYPFIAQIVQCAINLLTERVEQLGFGPPPRSWTQRAANPVPEPYADPITGRWGYRDAGGNPVIETAFTQVGDFRGGIAAVCQADWGAIDKTGQVVVPLNFASLDTPTPDGRIVAGFVNGVAVADTGGVKGVVHRSGKMLVEPRFQHVIVHPAGLIVSVDGRTWSALNLEGAQLLSGQADQQDVIRFLKAVAIDDGPL
ncbi:WG repeat-containing protein [Natronoglycomyces albus]|uniref:WG repeat-containing protein n=1 Tax=Natronoglycomyces albus TaxID=2811108 RepID=A0A895XL32_9ACTN|nr:WG repeat-containing protein [Natronoglycomyces albus]QSB06421.1 WG repeat-containing protein [Natronoglycomyces albus]